MLILLLCRKRRAGCCTVYQVSFIRPTALIGPIFHNPSKSIKVLNQRLMQSPVRQQQRQVLLLAAGFEKRPVHHKVSATHLRLIDQLFGQISRCCPKAARHRQHFSIIRCFKRNQGLPNARAKKKNKIWSRTKF